MHVTLVQLNIAWQDKLANFVRVRELLAAQPPRPGSLVILPEMFATGFSRNLDATRQARPPECDEFLADLARTYDCCTLGGVVGADEEGNARNDAVAFFPSGELAQRFTKIHPFSLVGEHLVHQAGHAVVSFAWGGFSIAPLVCYDLRFPESFREAARYGADLFVVIANWPSPRVEHWITLLRARAIENQAFVIGVNRAGRDPELEYPGRSVVIDPQGVIVADAGPAESVLHAEIDPGVASNWRRDFPALADARW